MTAKCFETLDCEAFVIYGCNAKETSMSSDRKHLKDIAVFYSGESPSKLECDINAGRLMANVRR